METRSLHTVYEKRTFFFSLSEIESYDDVTPHEASDKFIDIWVNQRHLQMYFKALLKATASLYNIMGKSEKK